MDLNAFHADPQFSVTSLTAAITELETPPTTLASLGLFEEKGINTTHFEIEFDGKTLTLVMPSERGEPTEGQTKANRRKIPFSCVHLPVPFHIKADEITNVRAFGSQTEHESIQEVVNQHLFEARQRLVATREFMRAGAITGKVYDAKGNLLLDIRTAFGLEAQTVTSFDKTAENTKAMLSAAKRRAKVALGVSMVNKWLLICGSNFFDDFAAAEDVKTYLQNRNGNSNDNVADMTDGLTFHGVTAFSYDAEVNGTKFIDEDEAYLVPQVPGLLIGRNAPADYVETVGTMGLPFYAKQGLLPLGKGIQGEAQSNPLYLSTRPDAIQKFSLADSSDDS